jgi:coenzyme F420 hydrogenase subunit delta
MQNNIPDRYRKPILVFGCGNILFGDDGFGPYVVEFLKKNYSIPSDVEVLDVGCSVRSILFDITLSDKKPKKIIIVDAIDAGQSPGNIFDVELEEIPENKLDDFSMHQLPTSNLLKELKELCKVQIKIISCQPEFIPDRVSTGLSKKLKDCIPRVCELILKEIKKA